MKNTQIRIFNSYNSSAVDQLNEFIKGREIIDIKQDVVVAATGNFFTQYLVIYKQGVDTNDE